MENIIPKNVRNEIKFVTYQGNLDILKIWLKLHEASFRTLYPKRWINNIYFDTYGFDCFRANISGTSSRAKVRYRWYGEFLKSKNGSLEIKRKRNFFGWKHNFKVYNGPEINKHCWGKIKNILFSQIPVQAKLWLQYHPMPVLINRYFREYLTTQDKKIRVTIDKKEKLWDQQCGYKPNINSSNILPEMIVI